MINYKDAAIGVFDSGMGGLTVLQALNEHLLNESFIYLGDTARLPYGTKSTKTVTHYAVQMAKILVDYGIKALVIACNTATTAALPTLKSLLPDLPILGVVQPGANAAILATKNHKIAVLATETTIAAKAYHNIIMEHLPNAKVKSRACSLLVALAEEGMTNNAIAHAVLSHYLEGFSNEDTFVLGCTHFPIFKPLLRSMLSTNVSIVDAAQSTAAILKQILFEKDMLKGEGSLQNKFLVTDSIARFQKVGEIFLQNSISADTIELIDV